MWTGAEWVSDGVWRWASDKTELLYTDWLTGQPSADANKKCIEMWWPDWKWGNEECLRISKFVCQWLP